MRHPELPVVSFLCIPMLLCSLPSHIRAGSVSTTALIAWMGTMSLIRGINSLLWANNYIVKLQVWCDITTKITVGFTFAVPAAALCILRHLENVSSARHARTTKADKRRRQKSEALMCLGVPMVFMALHYVVQGHRFDLFEDFGCYPTVYFSVAAIVLVYVPPLAMSMASFVYAGMALRHFLQHRIEFAMHLQNSQSAISPGRYFRLMALAVVEMVWDSGVNIYIIWFNTLAGLRPWISWENVHSNFSRVGVIPEFLDPPELTTQLVFQWWIIPVSCIIFFIFFGFGEEAIADYCLATRWFCRNILRRQVNTSITKVHNHAIVLPSYRPTLPHLGVSLPTISDSASERGFKTWDELPLKLPKIIEQRGPQSIGATTDLTPNPCPRTSIVLMPQNHSSYTSQSTKSFIGEGLFQFELLDKCSATPVDTASHPTTLENPHVPNVRPPPTPSQRKNGAPNMGHGPGTILGIPPASCPATSYIPSRT